jgi:hypothetical protein
MELVKNSINDRLSKLLDENLSSEDEQLFVQSFKTYLEYGSDDKKFIINFDDIWTWIGFTRKDNAKRLLIKSFIKDVDFILITKNDEGNNIENKLLLLKKEQDKTKKEWGGHNNETILMTVNTFKKFCMKASTKRADEVCNYYIKMENIMHRYFKEQLDDQRNIIKQIEENNLNKIKDLEDSNVISLENERHNSLTRSNNKIPLVYIMKLKINVNPNYTLYKIGQTIDIIRRVEQLKHEFGFDFIVTDVFPCQNNRAFETFLHNHKKIFPLNFKGRINFKKPTELFKIRDKNMYDMIKRVVIDNIYKFNYKRLDELKELNKSLELQKKLLNAQKELVSVQNESAKLEHLTKLYDFFKGNTEGLVKALEITNLNNIGKWVYEEEDQENKSEIEEETSEISQEIPKEIPKETPKENPQNQIDLQESESEEETETQNNSYGPKVQIYKIDDLTKVHRVFDGITEATRNILNTSYTHIKFAAKNKLSYVGYRWYLIDRHDKYANEPKDIGATKESATRRVGYIAMLDINKKMVEKVFGLQKYAAEFISQQVSAVSTAIKYSRPLNGNYWVFWDDLSDTMKNAYLENHELPKFETKSRGVSVQQIDIETNKVIRIFKSISDACKELKMSPRTIKSASIYDEVSNGYKWKLN